MVEKTEKGLIKDPAFLRAVLDFSQNNLNPHEPVAMFFASVSDQHRVHFIAGCESCYDRWKVLTA